MVATRLTTLSAKYQIVIPKVVRQRMRLSAGMRVSVYPLDEDRAVFVKHPADPVAALRGLGRDLWHSLGGGTRYIKGERASWKR